MTPISQNETPHLIDEAHKAIVFTLQNKIELAGFNEKVEKIYVHKILDENVLISHPEILDKENKIYRTKIIADLTHSFFFDHPLGHLPGILILEAARQFGTVISHLFFNVPTESQFILHDLGSQFIAGATTDNDVFIDVMITDAKIKKDKVRGLSGVGYVHQNGQVIGKITSSWSIIPNKVLAHLTKFH